MYSLLLLLFVILYPIDRRYAAVKGEIKKYRKELTKQKLIFFDFPCYSSKLIILKKII